MRIVGKAIVLVVLMGVAAGITAIAWGTYELMQADEQEWWS